MLKNLRKNLQWGRLYTKSAIKWCEFLGAASILMGVATPILYLLALKSELDVATAAMSVAAINFGLIILNDVNHMKHYHSDKIEK